MALLGQKANLARIRDNQRRSRARRKEYLNELETKYRTCEAIGVEASAEIQAAARKVLDENKRLRLLLKQQGLSDAEIDGSHAMSSSPASIKTDMTENSQFPTPSSSLDQMLTGRKSCKPSESGGCCKTEDESQDFRRMSGASSTSSQQQPPLVSTNAPRDQRLSIASGSHSTQQSPRNLSRSTVGTPVSAHYQPVTPHQHHNYEQQAPNYPMFNPQAHPGYMYPISMDHMQQWGMPPSVPQQQSGGHTMSAQSSPQFMPQQPATQPAYSAPNTSSCYVAADAIRSIAVGAGMEVEQALGCHDGRECHVSNDLVFDIMDRYSGQDGQRML